jgi:hypothetical protein
VANIINKMLDDYLFNYSIHWELLSKDENSIERFEKIKLMFYNSIINKLELNKFISNWLDNYELKKNKIVNIKLL